MRILFFVALVLALIFFYIKIFRKRTWKTPTEKLSESHRKILAQYVNFYNRLDAEKKTQFEYEVNEFLINYKITPVSTTIGETEKVLIAASGVIPIFNFPDWKYQNLTEILVYSDTFNKDFEVEGEQRNVLGMVGTGVYSHKMLLSKKSIINGYASNHDGHNTAIHEFVHLIDGADGSIDGVPNFLLEQPAVMPWLDLINKEINNIREQDSELRTYAATNNSEFFAVASEYFFERPDLLEESHPELFALLGKIFSAKK